MDAPSEHPDAAWRQRADWVKGEVEDEGTRTRGAAAVAAVLLSVVAAGLLALAWFHGEIWWFFALVTGVVAIGMVVVVVRQALRLRRFGRSYAVLERTPLRPGARFRARVRTGVRPTAPSPRFDVELACVRRWEEERGSGDDRKTERRSEVVWKDARAATGEVDAGGGGVAALSVPVAFELPDHPPTSAIGAWEGIVWELKLRAELPGLDYGATFELPVVREGDAGG